MSKVPYRNDSKDPVYVGPVLIMPGGMRDVAETYIPRDHSVPDDIDDAGVNEAAGLLDVLGGSVNDLTDALAGVDEDGNSLFSDEDLIHLISAEADGKNRSTALEAIQAEMFDRAAGDEDESGSDDEASGD